MSSATRGLRPATCSLEELAALIIAVTDRLQRRLRPGYHMTRLSPARLSALSLIVTEGSCTAGQIAQAEQVTAATITRIVDGLEESGLITRTPSRRDRRMVELQPTSEGRAALRDAKDRQIMRLAGELAPLDQDDCLRMFDAVDILDRLSQQRRG